MVTSMVIVSVAIVGYAVFWSWYVGFGHKISEQQLSCYMACIEQTQLSPESIESFRNFFTNDDGKEFFMVNLLHLKSPKRESIALLDKYTSVFVSKLMKRAGHPYFFGLAQAMNIENVHCDTADGWTSAAIMRYRSRKDLGDMIVDTLGQEHHGFKLAALEKTLAFPVSGTLNIGSVPLMVGLVVALISCVIHLMIG